jgi:hypothetical protein
VDSKREKKKKAGSTGKSSGGSVQPQAPTMTPSQAAHAVRRNQGPPGLHRIDPPRFPGELWHAHIGSGTGSPAVNIDGTWKHGPGILTNDQRDFLRDAGWQV